MKSIKLVVILNLLLTSCATSTKSTFLGAAIGGSIGAAMGQSQSRNSEETAIGAAVGIGLGSLLGYLSYEDKLKKKDSDKNENPEEVIPFLTKPKIRSYIVPDSIEGNKFIKSHRVFILEDPGSWSR